VACDVSSATEHQLFGRVDVALNCSIYLRDSHLDLGFCNLSASAYDQRTIIGNDVTREVSIDPQHRFETNFARKSHHVTNETKPIIFVDIGALGIYEFWRRAFVSARNGLSSHWLLPSFLEFGWVGSRRVPPPLLEEKAELPNEITL
jgi:hypothetical protein